MARDEQLRYGAGGKALRLGRTRGGVYDRPLSGRHAPPELRATADPRRQSWLSKIVDPLAPILKDSASSCFLSSPFCKSLPAIGPAPEDDSDASQKSHGQIGGADYGSVTEDVLNGSLRSEQICRQMREIYFRLQNNNTKNPPLNPSAPLEKFSCKKVLFQSSSDNPRVDDKETTNVANVPDIILISDDSDESDNERVEDDASEKDNLGGVVGFRDETDVKVIHGGKEPIYLDTIKIDLQGAAPQIAKKTIEIELFLDDTDKKYLVVDLKY